MKTIVYLVLLLSALPSFSQKKDTVLILAGSKILKSNLLRDYKGSYDFFNSKDGVETLVGSLEDHFQIFTKNKEPMALRVCKITFGANSILDSGLCRLQGLAPIYHRSVQTKKNMDLKFSGEQVTGKIIFKNDNPKVEAIDYKTPSPLFDSFYEDILAKVIDLENGTLFRFPEYIYEKGGTVWSVGEILNNEGASERVVKFYELNPKNEITRTTTFTINKSTSEIVRREYQMGSNTIIMKKKS